jgi:HPt (histidine-containing phosphotransfer) domain-containing protein
MLAILLSDNLDELIASLGNEFLDLVRQFATKLPEEVAAMQDALGRGDCLALQRAAHTLKGSSSHLGALALSDCAAQLERAARAEDVEACAREMQRLIALAGETVAALRAGGYLLN